MVRKWTFCVRHYVCVNNSWLHIEHQASVQLSTSSSNGQSKTDRWDFPRHRLKFFNILGEGAFGQVWRCEAIDIDGK